MAVRRLLDRLGVCRWLDERTDEVSGFFRPSLMVEVWVALLLYGGGWLEDLELLATRGIRRLFGWARVPDPTTFGRWLRRAAPGLLPVVDRLIRHLVKLRWTEAVIRSPSEKAHDRSRRPAHQGPPPKSAS